MFQSNTFTSQLRPEVQYKRK